MVIILSFNSLDEPTNDLIEWLKLKKTKFLRINGSDFKSPNKITLNLSEKSFIINNKKYFENDISVVWYRRWNEPNNEKSIHEIIKENELDVNESIFLSRYRKYLKS